jgi:hypothetical protein
MEIINVIEINSGIVDSVKSYPITCLEDKEEIVQKAEDEFIRQAKEAGWNPDWHYCKTEYDLIEEGDFDSANGCINISLVWSTIINN